MRILHIIDTLRSGGRERQLLELLKGLSEKNNISCELIVMSEDIHYSYLNDYNIKIHFLLRNSKNDITIFFKLYKLIKSIRPDILHSWGSMCSVYCLPFILLSKVPFINGFLRNAPPKWNWRNKDWIRCLITFPFSDAIIANSNTALEIYNVPPAKGYCIHNGFDFSRINNIPCPISMREKLGIDKKHIVGMVASFTDKKDFSSFIICALEILKVREDVTFIAVGDGENRIQCENMIPESYKEHFIFTGKVLDSEAIINIFDIGLLLSNMKLHGEGISNSIMEYMALQKPVIASNSGGNKELVVHEKTGYIVPNNSVENLVPRIIYLLDNPNFSSQMGAAGLSRIKADFNFSSLINRYMEIYEEKLVGN